MLRNIVLALTLVLAGCGARPQAVPVTNTEFINIQVPASLMQACAITPPPSRATLEALGDRAQATAAAWTITRDQELQSCAARHNGLVNAINNYRDRINQLNAENESNG